MSCFSIGRRSLLNLRIRPAQRYGNSTTTSTVPEIKKLYIRNVFKDNPSAKYYALTVIAVATGTTYYVYNKRQKTKFILKLLSSAPSHFTVPQDTEIDKLRSFLDRQGSLHQVSISGPLGSGKTQLARLLAENLNETRRESFQFKLWPKDEITFSLFAKTKESLLSSLKELASKLGCEKDEVKLDCCNLDKQLDVFSQVVKEKLKQKTCWILVIDDLDEDKDLTKWLPDSAWGNGYVIYTINSECTGHSDNKKHFANLSLNQITSESAKQIFSGITGENCDENLLNLLQYNPLSIACTAIYFQCKVQQNKNYSHENLYTDIEQTLKQLQKDNPDFNQLWIIQTSSVALATKVLGENSPELLHVFDFLGSCNVNKPLPVSMFSHHLKTSEYHVQMKPEEAAEQFVNNEEANLSVNPSFEHEHNLWSFRGIVDRSVKLYERIKLEVDAIRSLFGYGDAALGIQSKPASDGLDAIRSCPLFLVSHEPMADIEVITTHPIVHNVLRQVFLNITIPLLEQQHLLLAERKHQQKSYFGRLRSFDPQASLAEYRRGLGDVQSLKSDEENFTFTCVGSILDSKEDDDSVSQAQSISRHFQEHLGRVVDSLSCHYRIAGGDSNVMVSRSLLLPHLESIAQERNLTAASKAQVYRTMANIHSEVFADNASSMRLLNEAYAITKERYGEDSLEIAGILTDQAELCSATEKLDQSKVLLERAVEIYQKDIKTSQTNKQPFHYGKALVALGVACGSLGDTGRSKDLLEKGLMELQNAAPEDPQAKENKWFAAEISSAVTYLGHAYIALGKINQGRKLLELALIGHQNVHGDTHQEVIRTLTTLSIAHAMQGNSQESKRLRNEAGKIQKKLDIRTPLFLQ
ncbi:uncharacterized protein LOC114526451 [Dendronephthya gigantea]|uniref:uncharacterized protein LOC114526451 n=1 Tax=Dendronephthya gigantea TaxID=151771 RepID=UPI00106A6F16|nr:uncharacterized protein LOC114526451 [Dendronephthya gigantea]